MVSETHSSPQPTAFTISVVFGGTIGLVAANLLGYDGGAGFFIGAGLVFLILAILIIQARQGEIIEIRLDALADLIVVDLAEKDREVEQRSTSEDLSSDPLSDNTFGMAGVPFSVQQMKEVIRRLEKNLDKNTIVRTSEPTWSKLIKRGFYKPHSRIRRQEEEVYYRRLLRLLMDQRNIRNR